MSCQPRCSHSSRWARPCRMSSTARAKLRVGARPLGITGLSIVLVAGTSSEDTGGMSPDREPVGTGCTTCWWPCRYDWLPIALQVLAAAAQMGTVVRLGAATRRQRAPAHLLQLHPRRHLLGE